MRNELMLQLLKNAWVEDIKVQGNFLLVKFGPKEDLLKIEFSNVELNPKGDECQNSIIQK